MNSHIKEHSAALLAVLVGVVLLLSIAVYAFMPSAPSGEPLPEDSAAEQDADLLRRPEVSLPDISVETTWSRPSDEVEPEEPTISAMETSEPEESEPEQSADDTPSVSDEPEPSAPEPSVPEEPTSSGGESDPITEPITGPETDPEQGPATGNDGGNKEYTLNVCVTSTSGKLLKGAEVSVGDVSGRTDSDGCFSATVTDSETSLLVVCSGYVSYYEDLTLTGALLDTTILLAPIDTTRRLLNSAELRPYRTDNAEFNRALDELLGEILKPGMDTYDKVKACYDWEIAHMYYKRPSHKEQGYWACAYQALQDGYGTCNCYSLLFTAMMRYIGLNCYYVEGATSASGGGMTGHFWTIIEIGGEYYVFDPQVEDAIAERTSSKEVTYVRFCLKEPHAKYVYSVKSRSSYIKSFESYLQSHGRFLNG